ncbi:MAG: hypothetical protein OEY48_06340 [Gammaproteobacteria bacterium]|nr:hypothetical protein [Gammaproteobacteria bacterium]MDH5592451.1 hypothetical protein [Gammaproteobacteria bacterium]
MGSEKIVDVVIAVDPELSTDESHNIASTIELLIEQKFDISDSSIHVEPFNKLS